jgi:hypothetical protein
MNGLGENVLMWRGMHEGNLPCGLPGRKASAPFMQRKFATHGSRAKDNRRALGCNLGRFVSIARGTKFSQNGECQKGAERRLSL